MQINKQPLPIALDRSLNVQIMITLKLANGMSNNSLIANKATFECMITGWRCNGWQIPEYLEEGVKLIGKVIELRGGWEEIKPKVDG